MVKLASSWIALLLLLGLLGATTASDSSQVHPEKPRPEPSGAPEAVRDLEVWAWNGHHDAKEIRKQMNAVRGVGIVMPSWFDLLAADGEWYDKSDDAVARETSGRGIRVMPMVSNRHQGEITEQFLQSPDAMQSLIRTLVARLDEMKLGGANLDFEGLSPQSRGPYAEFVAAFAAALHERGMQLTVDVPVTESGGMPEWFAAKEIGAAADQVVLMAYDQYYEGHAEPGPVAGLEWTEQGIRSALDAGVPASKLVLGLPLYTREWLLDGGGKAKSSRPLSMKAIPGTLIGYDNVKRVMDENHGLHRTSYGNSRERFLIWEESLATVKERYSLARLYGLHGVAFWRLGYEPNQFWQEVGRWKSE